MLEKLKEKVISKLGGQVKKAPRSYGEILEPHISNIRIDIRQWRQAKNMARLREDPKRYPLQQIFEEATEDAHLFSQLDNRTSDLLGSNFVLKNASGDIDEELTTEVKTTIWFNDIIRYVNETKFYGHTLINLVWEEEKLKVEIIPRTNVEPRQGLLYYDHTLDKKEKYRNLPEYGIWLLEFGKPKDLGLLNKVVAPYLFKKFAQSCWSELCEIYGIPPRVLKTDTQDKAALRRGEKMMQEMGSAAWIIIDSVEEFDFAKGVSTNGDVYNNLISLCKNEISTLLTGAVMGQDTKHGSRGKEQSSQDLLNTLVKFDKIGVQKDLNEKVIPALIRIGVLPEGTSFEYEVAEDIETLWSMVVDALPHYNVDPEWVKTKFGIEITGERAKTPNTETNLGADFFV